MPLESLAQAMNRISAEVRGGPLSNMAEGGPVMKAYEPTWRDRIAQTLMGDGRASPERRNFVQGLMGSTGLGTTGLGVADVVPGGQALAAQEALREGDYKGAAMAMMPLPAAGKLGQAAKSAGKTRSIADAVDAYNPIVEISSRTNMPTQTDKAQALADKLIKELGNDFELVTSKTDFGNSFYIRRKGDDPNWGPRLRVSDHFANPANRPGEFQVWDDEDRLSEGLKYLRGERTIATVTETAVPNGAEFAAIRDTKSGRSFAGQSHEQILKRNPFLKETGELGYIDAKGNWLNQAVAAEKAEGGAVYDPMGNVSVPPSEGFAPSPAYENIADALARAGAVVGRPTVGALETAARVYSEKSREAAAENEALRQQAMRNMQGELGYAGMPLGAGQMLLSQLGTATLPLTAAAKAAGYAATQATGNPRFGENVEMLSGFVDPSHVGMLKAAAPMAGAAAARQAVQTARELSPLGLYSHGAEAAAALQQAKGSPEQMVAQLRSAGVRPAELFFTGIADEAATNALRTKIESEMSPRIAQAEEALKSLTPGTKEFKDAERQLNNLKGTMRSEMDRALVIAPDWASRPSVTREEIAQHLREQMPMVEETVLGKTTKGQPYPAEAIEIEQKIIDRYRSDLDRLFSITVDYSQPREVRAAAQREYEKLIDRKYFEIDDAIPNREQLIEASRDKTTPTKFQEYTLPGGENYREVLLKHEPNPSPISEQKYYDLANKAEREVLSDAEKDQMRAYTAWKNNDEKKNISSFKSSHWDDPNVLVHLRMSDRTGPNGEKILHVEELQSDWGQQGRKVGFSDPAAKVAAKEKMDQLSTKYDELGRERRLAEKEMRELPDYNDRFEQLQNRVSQIGQERDLLSDQMADLRATIKGDAIPPAPYVTSTEGWTDLALKRVLKEAAEGGYDRVVFTPGAEQAKRYNLSKQLSKIEYHEPSGTLNAYDPSGKKVISKSYKPEQLPDVVGKDVADKLLKSEPESMGVKSLSGLDLQVGGEGMKAYYDKMVPKRLQELVRKHDKGAKVEQQTIPIGRGKPTQYRDFAEWSSAPETAEIPMSGITITPQMRESILRGQPHMAEGGEVKKKAIEDVVEQAPTKEETLKLAAEHGLHRPQIAAILRQNDPRLSPVQATARAREIMAGDTQALRGILSDKLMAELRHMLKGARP